MALQTFPSKHFTIPHLEGTKLMARSTAPMSPVMGREWEPKNWGLWGPLEKGIDLGQLKDSKRCQILWNLGVLTPFPKWWLVFTSRNNDGADNHQPLWSIYCVLGPVPHMMSPCNPCNCLMRNRPLVCPFYRWGNWSLRRDVKCLVKVTGQGGVPGSSAAKKFTCQMQETWAQSLGSIPGEGYGNPLQYSCQGNPTDREAWWATIHGVARVEHNLATKPPPPTHTGLLFSAPSGSILWPSFTKHTFCLYIVNFLMICSFTGVPYLWWVHPNSHTTFGILEGRSYIPPSSAILFSPSRVSCHNG